MRAAGITLTLAALVIALLAVTFTAGQADATTTNIVPSGDYDSTTQGQAATATPTPRHKTPEPCPGGEGRSDDEAAAVIDSGQYALFDVWWNPDEGELTNTICPPSTRYARVGRVGGVTKRSQSSIDITADPPTIIHIPRSAMVDLSTTTEYTRERYPAVWEADGAENRPNAEGTPVPGKGDGIVWVLPPCPHLGNVAAVGDLCLSFSSVLLKSADWKPNTKIKFHLDHVHQKDLDRQLPRYTLAYDVRPGSVAAPGGFHPEWNSRNANIAVMGVTPNRYEHPTWILTSRGTYDLQVHITGEPSSALGVAEPSVNSDQQKYILHVGAEADLGVAIRATPENPSPTGNVTVKITASNAGPDAAPNAKVDVALPEGLTYWAHSGEGTYADGVWTIGELAKDASKILFITASVDRGTHGKALASKATISATEPVKVTETVDGVQTEVTHHVPVPDPTPGNDMATGTITVAALPNVEPMFSAARSVPENTPHGHPVGAPVPVLAGDSDPLSYTLSGADASSFTVESVATGGQIRVHGSADLDFETRSSYQVVLNVSDGKDASGNSDPAIDSSIAVPISITDVAETVRVTATCEKVGERGTCTATVSNLPSADTVITYSWTLFDLPTNSWSHVGHNSNTYSVSYTTPGTRKFQVHVVYTDANGKKHYVHSGFPALTWQ